jgi:hypothetical protein
MILGEWTVGELADFLKSVRYQATQIRQGYADASPAWAARDAKSFEAFTNDIHAADLALDDAAASSQSEINLTPGFLMDISPALSWNNLRDAFAPYDGLYKRLVNEQGAKIDMSQNPQPTAPDVDLQTFIAADTATKAIDRAGAGAVDLAGSLWAKAKPYVIGGACLLGVGVVVTAKVASKVP